MSGVGTLQLHCPFTYSVLAVFQLWTLVLAPSVWDLDDHPRTLDTSLAVPGELMRSPALESEGTTPQHASPSSLSPRVWIPVNQVLGDHDPCPETRTPTKKELQKVRSPAHWPSMPTSSHPQFTSPVPRPLGIPPPPSASTSTGRR